MLPPSPVTIAVIIVIAIVVFLPVSEETPPELRELQDELAGLGADVLAAAGRERTARISNLLRRMRGEQVGP